MKKKQNDCSDALTTDDCRMSDDFGRELPPVDLLENELARVNVKHKFFDKLRSTTFIFVIIAAIAVLLATLFMPVLRIYGNSMTPTLEEDQIVVALKTGNFQTGDVVAFYYNNKILVKRVIARTGDWVDIKDDGTVYINGEKIEEPYIYDKSIGQCDIKMPYQVPEEKVFVMGDHRSTSIDSRTTVVGCVSEEQIVGRILFRVWPLKDITTFN